MCGLKRNQVKQLIYEYPVTPFVGVWIETWWRSSMPMLPLVTPFVGVWIETENTARQYETSLVTPFVGVWIET